MPTVVQFRRGTTAQNNSFTGQSGELTVDTQLGTLRVHNGTTGGNILASIDAVQTLSNKTLSAPVVTGTLSSSGLINTSGNVLAVVLNAQGTTTSTSTTTGALLVAGGAGIVGNLNVGDGTLLGGTHKFQGNVVPFASNTYTLGTNTAWWTVTYSRAVQAQYADLAEIYNSDQQYPAGTVVVFGGEQEIMQSHSSHDTRIAGVVSTDPAYLMNSQSVGIPVALQGRVPCRVLGPISKGDRVVSSHIAGVAQALDPLHYQPGCIIGKALQSIDSAEISVIEVVVGRV